MRQGKSPDGHRYYPAFPYPSFTLLTDADLADLWAYLRTVAPAPVPSRPHEVRRPYRGRWKLAFWRLFGFREGPFEADPEVAAELERGRYLVTALAHCGECHTPRGGLGRLRRRRALGGSEEPPEPSPNLTPHPEALGAWTVEDWVDLLEWGSLPSGDVVGGAMWDVVDEGTAYLSDEDRRAMAVYLRALPPVAP